MIYTQLTPDYKYDTIAEAIYAREVEYFHYDFDRTNFQYLLAIAPDGEFKTATAERLASTMQQMNSVEAIMDALRSQIDNEQAYSDAVIRVTAKRKANKESE
jgi:IS5 family transposase